MPKIPINIKTGKIEEREEIIVGIDLGTTNSLVAVHQDDQIRTLTNTEGSSALIPSVIFFAPDGAIVVGEEAKMQAAIYPERTVFSVKRLMGKAFSDIASYQDFFGYDILDDDDESLVKVRISDRFYTPIELSAAILRALKKIVETHVGRSVSKAVITVPAYFNDTQRQATRDAGKLGGWDVLRILNEPTAASLAYGFNSSTAKGKNVAVYDLGGGTFDISILSIDEGVFQVLSTHGDTWLGGDDFDKAVLDHWFSRHPELEKQARRDPKIFQEMRLAAEGAKVELSSGEAFSSTIANHRLTLDRTTFNELITPIVDRTISSCMQALKDSKLNKDEIHEVVLAGGSTRVPLVREKVAKFFGQKPNHSLDPDLVVAMGAAVQANILAGRERGLLLLDVTPLSLGIETVGGLMDVIIPRNTTVPVRAARNYTTSVDGQKNLKVSVYQGERDLVSENRKLGTFILKDIPPMAAGLPKIEIRFVIDADGILRVKAIEQRSNIEQEVEIRSQYGITEEEMAKMLLESIRHAEDDMKVKALTEARNEARYMLNAADKFFKQHPELIDGEAKSSILEVKQQLEASLQGEDKDQIMNLVDAFNELTRPFAQIAMDEVIGSAMTGKNIDGIE